MAGSNETSTFRVEFLRDVSIETIHAVFVEAFSDYYFRFHLSENQFRNHIRLNAVDLDRSIGCFDGERLIGVSLNGFGDWGGLPTVYDAGTGVIPSHRRRGASEQMLTTMMSVFREQGIKQCLLEVIDANASAIGLYEKLGFEKVRVLLLLEADDLEIPDAPTPDNLLIKEMDKPDWRVFESFGDGRPSWQNSREAIDRSVHMKKIVGAFLDGRCVGFIAFSAGVGRVAQMGVDPEHRRLGIGSMLLKTMKTDLREGFKLQVINIDAALTDCLAFFRNRGFRTVLSQIEMRKTC